MAVLLGNCPQFHIVFYAILKLGAVYVPVNPLFKEHELAYELNDAGATMVIALDTLVPMLMAVKPHTRVGTVFATSAAEFLPAHPTLPVPPGLDAAPVALRLDPDDPKGLALPASAAAERGDTAQAITYWEHLYRLLPPDSQTAGRIAANLAAARGATGPAQRQ